MTDVKLPDQQSDKKQTKSKGKIGKSLRRHFVNYLFIAIAGTFLVTVVSTLAKAYWTKMPCDKAPAILAAGNASEVVDKLEQTARFERLFPALKPRRDIIAIRCHARQDNLGKAMGIADAMASSPSKPPSIMEFLKGFIPPDSVETLVDRFSYFINNMEYPLATAVNMVFDRQNTQMQIDSWSGYSTLANELKAAEDTAGLERLLNTAKEYHPDAKFTASLQGYMDKARRYAQAGKRIPRPDEIKNAPRGWAIVKEPNTAIYDGSGHKDRVVQEGTLIEVDEIRDSKSGKLVVGSIHYRNSQKDGIIVLAKDVSLQRGLIFEIEDSVKDKLFTRAELTEKIAETTKSAEDRLATQNPYLAEYKQVKAEYEAYWARVKDIQSKHEKSSGAEREKYFGELRKLKGKDIVLGNSLKEARTKAENWIKANSHLARTGPEVGQMKQRLAEIEAELKPLGYL